MNRIVTLTFLVIFLFTSQWLNAQNRFHSTFKNKILKQKHQSGSRKIAGIGNYAGNWSVSNWYWLIEGSADNIEELLEVNTDKYLSVFPDYFFLTKNYNGFVWNQWDNWKNFLVEGSDEYFYTTFDTDGNITEYTIRKQTTYTMTYTSDNLPKEWVTSEWDSLQNQWDLPYKYEFGYNTDKTLKEISIYYREETNGEWLAAYHYTYTYDSQKNISEEIYEEWNSETQAWEKGARWTFTYNDNNLLSEDIEYLWDNEAGEWYISEDYESKSTYTYNQKKELTEHIAYYWLAQSQEWWQSTKYTLVYNSQGSLTEEMTSSWDESAQNWEPSGFKYTFQYNNDNNLAEELSFAWDTLSQNWVSTDEKYTYTYNSAGDLSEEIDYQLEGSQWVNNYKQMFSYKSGQRQPQKCEFFTFDQQNQTWELDDVFTITFDASIPINKPQQTYHPAYTITYKQNARGISIILPGKSCGREKMQLFDLQGRLLQEFSPLYNNENTIFQWDGTSKSGVTFGQKLILYTITKGTHSLKGRLPNFPMK